ncbi:potassium channel subfamily K member 1-like [Corythoichthys intestinalis]|uniref:potassium channel subfamily K member 1-like n=1 Tax=Corythoichthys intestinalis TaxID=161448 RepID=UPI0025A5DD19|nr:potassium channel subfamily K member 1-like [Corythoichthys intestinalis]XP_061807747.1 potassium channel subfamily K member 1-like [Nerophis lumbriciformis]
MGGVCARFAERNRATLNFALLVVGYAAYLLVGAGIFSAVELPYEVRLRSKLEASHRDFLANNTCVSDDSLREILTRALEANNYGVSVLRKSSRRNWDFVSSLFFTSTVLTTTGYGHTVPLSDEGKAFCIFYSLVGIPLTLFFLSAVVQRIMLAVTRRPLAYFPHRWAVSKAKFALIHAVVLAVAVTIVIFFIPACIFFTMERDWNFLESIYFCFISLTTIGLGDYVPGETHGTEDNPHRQLYKLFITLYLLLGLVCILVLMETCVELPHMKRLRQQFYHDSLPRELEAETANIIEREHPTDMSEHVIPSVSERAETSRDSAAPYTPATVFNGKLN